MSGEEERAFTREDVSHFCSREKCFVIVHDGVYDVTKFLKQHPGGEEIIMEIAGGDATTRFVNTGHTSDARALLATLRVGRLHKPAA